VQEIADFLAVHPPFTELERAELDKLATVVDVQYHLAGDRVIEPGQPSLGAALVVRVGRIDELNSEGTVVDEIEAGDVFSLDTVRAGLAYRTAARAAEDSLIYLVPLPDKLKGGHVAPLSSSGQLTRLERLFDAAQGKVVDSMRPIILYDASTPITEVAQAMSAAHTSCSLVTLPDNQIGVVTDSDMRRRVATGEVPVTAPVGTIATYPALTIGSDALLGDAYLAMVDVGIHHLVVVDTRGHPIGVMRTLDVASAELRNPLMVRGFIERAETQEDLVQAGALLMPSIVELIDSGLSIDYVARLQSGVVDAIVRRAVALGSTLDVSPPSVWLVQGSMARREPLPSSDVDTAVCRPVGSSGDASLHLQDASRVLRLIEQTGLATCDKGANADNPLFNRTEDEWRQAVARWFDNEDVVGVLALASIVADTRPVTGEPVSPLVEAVSAAVSHERFMRVLARHSLSLRPPLGFVRDFVVHHSGEYRGQLDLKRGGLIPVSTLARWLALRTGDVSGSSLERLDRGVEAGLITSDHRDMLAGAYTIFMTVLAKQQARTIKAGEKPSGFLRPDQLDPLQRRQLREAFRAVDAVQSELAARAGMSRL